MASVYTVAQVTSYISHLFEEDFALKRISIQGEISNCKKHSCGHLYFTLKDETSTLSCVMFASNRAKLTFIPSEGMRVIARGSVRIYERDGVYQLYVTQLEPAGVGEWFRLFEERKAQFEEMGMFSEEYKKPIPRFAKKVGVVTAKTGAAIQDIINITHRRNPYVQLILYPTLVQGESAAVNIAAGIDYLDTLGLDVIIVGRGGGSIEDLWAFNEMPVADAIYEADTPIISGTGHEVDMTIADYCADVRAATPSAACELAIPDMQSVFTKLSNYREALDMQVEQRCAQLRQQMILLQRQLEAGRPDRKLLKYKLLYERLENRLSQAIKEKYRSRQQMFSRYVDQLSGLAPTNRLKGGYAFAQTKNGRPVASIEQLEKEVPFSLTFSDGEAEVIPVHLKKNKK